VTVSGYVETGYELGNTAVITNPNGPGATPSAPPVVVSQSQQPASGGKVLYIHADKTLSREQPLTQSDSDPVASQTGTISFHLEPLAAPLIITPGSTIEVSLLLTTDDYPTVERRIHVQLWKNGNVPI